MNAGSVGPLPSGKEDTRHVQTVGGLRLTTPLKLLDDDNDDDGDDG